MWNAGGGERDRRGKGKDGEVRGRKVRELNK